MLTVADRLALMPGLTQHIPQSKATPLIADTLCHWASATSLASQVPFVTVQVPTLWWQWGCWLGRQVAAQGALPHVLGQALHELRNLWGPLSQEDIPPLPALGADSHGDLGVL